MLDGEPVEGGTEAVIWGEAGNNGQHSFFQLLHQGSGRAALHFLLPARSSWGNQAHQNLAIASCFAQAEALTNGQSAETVRAELEHQGLPPAQIDALIPHKINPGSRPLTLVLFRQLDPPTLGRLIALYEHSVLTQSVVWGINAFDQWGVELGKKLTSQLAPAVDDPAGGHPVPVTVGKLIARIDQWRR